MGGRRFCYIGEHISYINREKSDPFGEIFWGILRSQTHPRRCKIVQNGLDFAKISRLRRSKTPSPPHKLPHTAAASAKLLLMPMVLSLLKQYPPNNPRAVTFITRLIRRLTRRRFTKLSTAGMNNSTGFTTVAAMHDKKTVQRERRM